MQFPVKKFQKGYVVTLQRVICVHISWGDMYTSLGYEQSGTKPNLVAKILATKIGNLWV